MTESCSCEGLKKEIDQLKAQVESLPAGKGKRAPTEWTKYLKTCLPNKTGSFPEKMRACSADYKMGKR